MKPGRFISIAAWHRRCGGRLVSQGDAAYRPALVLSLETPEGLLSWGCRPPEHHRSTDVPVFCRYAAAVANNLVMTHGGTNLHIYSADGLFKPILRQLTTRYAPCVEMLGSPGGSPPAIVEARGWQPCALSAELPQPRGCAGQPQKSGCFLGVDIGNSQVKVALICNGDVAFSGQFGNTIRTGGRAPQEYFRWVISTTTRLLGTALGTTPMLQGAGIAWFGDASSGLPLTRAADLAAWQSGPSADELRTIPAILPELLACPVHLFGDSEALGRGLDRRRRLQHSYLFIYGTSAGGAYFGADGRYWAGENLISRIVVDLSPNAPRHAATGTPGVFQQYAGSYGVRLAGALAAGTDGTGAPPISDGARLAEVLEQGDRRGQERVTACLDHLARWLSAAVADIATHYQINRVYLSGGTMRDPVGGAMVRALRRKLVFKPLQSLEIGLLCEETGWSPAYEVAMAAAYLSGRRQPL